MIVVFSTVEIFIFFDVLMKKIIKSVELTGNNLKTIRLESRLMSRFIHNESFGDPNIVNCIFG